MRDPVLIVLAVIASSCVTPRVPVPRSFELADQPRLGELYRFWEWGDAVEELDRYTLVHKALSSPERWVIFRLDHDGLCVAEIEVEYAGQEKFDDLVTYYTKQLGPPDDRYVRHPRNVYRSASTSFPEQSRYEVAYWDDGATHLEIKRLWNEDLTRMRLIDHVLKCVAHTWR